MPAPLRLSDSPPPLALLRAALGLTPAPLAGAGSGRVGLPVAAGRRPGCRPGRLFGA